MAKEKPGLLAGLSGNYTNTQYLVLVGRRPPAICARHRVRNKLYEAWVSDLICVLCSDHVGHVRDKRRGLWPDVQKLRVEYRACCFFGFLVGQLGIFAHYGGGVGMMK